MNFAENRVSQPVHRRIYNANATISTPVAHQTSRAIRNSVGPRVPLKGGGVTENGILWPYMRS